MLLHHASASALQKGIHFRRAGFWAMNQVMEAGALGCEIVISGKLRTERARFEKFRAGYFPRCGEPALRYTRKTEAHVQLKARHVRRQSKNHASRRDSSQIKSKS